MGFFDFLKKKTIIQNESNNYMSKGNVNEIIYYEMTPSKAICPGIETTPIPSKTYETGKPKNVRFSDLTMYHFKKNVL